jgi:2-hydroxy-3-keto-5-methylthiopentenyl-1-phosphate phosphatase
VLFARNGKELANYCEKENIPFIGFDSFSTIHTIIKDLVDGISKLEKDPVSGYCKVIPSA